MPAPNDTPIVKTPQQVLAEQSVDPAKGLTPEDASARLQKYGPNAIEEKSQSALKRFLGYFWGRCRGWWRHQP